MTGKVHALVAGDGFVEGIVAVLLVTESGVGRVESAYGKAGELSGERLRRQIE